MSTHQACTHAHKYTHADMSHSTGGLLEAQGGHPKGLRGEGVLSLYPIPGW